MSGKRFFSTRFFATRHFASGHWAGVGVVLVQPQPDRVYIDLGLYRTVLVGLGVTREQKAAVGVTRSITIGVER